MIRFEILNGMSKNLTGVITLSLAIALLSSSANAERQPELAKLPQDAGFDGANQDVVQRHDLVIAHNRLQENAPIPGGAWNVDPDDHVNIFDLVRVAKKFGEKGANLPEDANGDGEVNTADLELVAQHFGEVYREGEIIPKSPGTIKRIDYGNVNSDGISKGVIDIVDASLVLDVAQGKKTLTPEQKILADVDGDGVITQIDAELILAKAGTPGMLFPVERRVIGDISGDGRVSIRDALLINKAMAKLVALNEEEKIRADVSGNGGLTQDDEILMSLAVARFFDRFPAEATIHYGDVDNDGNINAIDVGLILNAVNGRKDLNAVEKLRADVDGDGELTGHDVDLVSQKAARKISHFPIEPVVEEAGIFEKTGGFDQNDLVVGFIPTTENWVVQVTKIERREDGTIASITTWQGGELRKQGKDVVLYLDDMPEAGYVVTITMLDEFGRQSAPTAAFFAVGSKSR